MPGRPRGPSDGTSDWEQPECEQLRSHSIGTTAAASDLQMAATGAFAFPKGLARNGEDSDESDDDDGHCSPVFPVCKNMTLPSSASELLVVFDMDHTLVGDLVSLSDRDNVETNMPWSWWPEGKDRGISSASIVPYLQRGMMRPGLPELLSHLRLVGATIIVYTHSEDRWAVKVCQALERLAGWPFIHRVYSRMDCRDGHPEFKARKSLQFICEDLRSEDGLDWVGVDKTIMFDDDRAALAEHEAGRLVTVASYDHWAPCRWDENVNEEMLSRNPARLAQIVRASVVDWGIAPPSYAKMQSCASPQLTHADVRWATKMKKKESILLAFNQVVKLDRVMYDILDALDDVSDLQALPEKVRNHLANQKQPQSRRVPKRAAMSCSDVSSGESTPASRLTGAPSPPALRAPAKEGESPNKASGPGKMHPDPAAAHGPEEPPPNTDYADAPNTNVKGMTSSLKSLKIQPNLPPSTRIREPHLSLSPNSHQRPTSGEMTGSAASAKAATRAKVGAHLPPLRVPTRRLNVYAPRVPGAAAVGHSCSVGPSCCKVDEGADNKCAAGALEVPDTFDPHVQTELRKMKDLEARREKIKLMLTQNSTTITQQMAAKNGGKESLAGVLASRAPRPGTY